MKYSILKNQKGIAMVSVVMASFVVTAIAGAAYAKSFFEMRQVDREITRLQAYAAAEAGIQRAMAQIGVQAYTGFINWQTDIDVPTFTDVYNQCVGGYSNDCSFYASFDYPNEADWVTIYSTATVNGETRDLEARVFLESNFSKYLVFAQTTTFSSGNNAQYGEPDYTDTYGDGTPDYPQLVPQNEDDRAALYFTGTWDLTGSDIHLYGDANAQTKIIGDGSSQVHGDTYAGNFQLSSTGVVTNDGIDGNLVVGDGFDDDIDRNGDLTVNASDYPDRHDLTASGDGDSHPQETLVQINHSFYAAHNQIPSYVGSTAKNRYLKFVSIDNGNATRVEEYSNAAYSTKLTQYDLPSRSIVYVKGDIYCKGEVGGRVTFVSSDDIYFDGNLTYANSQTHADPDHSTAFFAKNKLYFRELDQTVSGILYAENSTGASAAFDGSCGVSGSCPYTQSGSKIRLRLFGNRIIKGGSNLSIFDDRVYAYDKNLKYFRPPGIPVVPDLKTVRERMPGSSGTGTGT